METNVTVQEGDNEDLKKLIGAVAAVAEEYRKFYGKGVKGAAMKARKALQDVRVQAANMRKQVQTDKVAGKKEKETA